MALPPSQRGHGYYLLILEAGCGEDVGTLRAHRVQAGGAGLAVWPGPSPTDASQPPRAHLERRTVTVQGTGPGMCKWCVVSPDLLCCDTGKVRQAWGLMSKRRRKENILPPFGLGTGGWLVGATLTSGWGTSGSLGCRGQCVFKAVLFFCSVALLSI